jgi:4-amino-4-deoxy-L-arabinose transferase-like glycosyltransferase
MNFWLAALAALTLLRLLLAATIPLSPDETYYVLWSLHLQPGYFDHPPMVAYFIRAGTTLFGNTPLGVRLLGPLAAAFGSMLLWDAGEKLLPGRHAGLAAAALFNATIILGVGSIIITPDTPLVFFWTAAIAALGRLHATRDPRWWLAIGAAAGLALLSKYTAILLLASVFLWLITSRDGRAALRTPWPWAAAALAALIFAPDIAWNAACHFVSFRKQGGRVDGFDPARSADFLAELVFGQFALATPIISGLIVYALIRLRRAAEPAETLLLWLTLLPCAVFLEHVISGRVEANWPAIIYPSACLAAATIREAVLLKWLRPALALGFAMTLAAYAQAIAAPFPIPAAHDPAALQLAGWPDLANQIAARHPAFVTSDEYTITSELAFNTPPATTITGFDPRWTYLTLPNAQISAGTAGILVTLRTDAPCPVLLGTATRKRGADAIATYKICRFTAPPNMVLIPHP